jgi:arabinan endo-1,5-alpha-L-arabinosidase
MNFSDPAPGKDRKSLSKQWIVKLQKWSWVIFAVLATAVPNNLSAQNSSWTGLGGDGFWSNPNNWSPVGVPPPGNSTNPIIGNITLNAANGWLTITVPPGQVESPGVGNSVEENNMIYGPEWGAVLDVYGTLNWDYYLAPVQDNPAYPTVVNLYGGGSMSGQGLALGDTWWYWGGPYVTMNIYSNATAAVNYMYWGGQVNLYGGILSVTNGLTLDTIGSVSDATRSMNLAGGELILPKNFTSTINNWIARGILLAYGKSGDSSDIVVSTTSIANRTVVNTTPLGGALQDIHLALATTNITVGGSQFLSVLGDYPGVQNVVMTSLNPATLPGTIGYQSANTNVAVVTSNSIVIAVTAGSTTITASLGAFTGTNSVTVTVPSATNSVPRLPEEQPVFGFAFAHDPGTMIFDGSRYYEFADGQGIDEIYSTDMRNWNYTYPIFPGNPPPWTTNLVPSFTGYFWAPDIVYVNHQYYLYYACSEWGTIDSGIGLVTTPSLISPVWTDRGEVIGYTNGIAINCIDPSILLDTNGTLWMSFGSYSDGVFVMQLDPITGKRLTNAPITKIEDNSLSFFSNTTEGSCLYQRGGYYYLFVNWGGCCAGVNSTYNIRVGRSPTVTGPYLDRSGKNMIGGGGSMFLESSGRFIGPGHAAVLNVNGTNWFTYHFYDGNNNGDATLGIGQLNWTADGWPAFTNDWSAFYPFNADASDAGGLYNGTLNGATITSDPGMGNVLGLNGSSQYATLPAPVANASTFMAWVKWNGGAQWQRVFDFGNGTTNYLFLTPLASSGNMRFAITTSGNGGEQQINAPFPLPTNSWCHVAVTVDGTVGLLYLNGVPVATNNSLTIRPWQTLPATNYIGHSQFGADPLFHGEISSFRIFGRALSGAEIQNLAYSPPSLAHRYSFSASSSNMVWDSVGMAHGALQGSATISNNALQLNGSYGNFVNLPGGLVSGSSAATIEFWATFGASGVGASVFAFGNITNQAGQNYLTLTPQYVTGGAQLAMATTGGAFNLSTPQSLNDLSVQVDCIIDPVNGYEAIYTNGTLMSSATGVVPPLNSVSPLWSFIGQSLFSSNAWLNASLDEFRIYGGRLTPAQIAANKQLGPGTASVPVGLGISGTRSNIKLAWPAYGIGYTVEWSPVLGANASWSPVSGAPVLSNNLWQVTLPGTNTSEFIRLVR